MHGEACRFDDVALAVERVDPRELEQERRALAGGTPSRSCGKRGRAGADIDLAHSGALAGFPNGAVDQHAAFVHHRDPVGKREHPVDIVLDQQHRQLGGDALDQRSDALALGGGEARQRLVEQQDAWSRRKCQSHVEQALSAVRECARLRPLGAG